MGADVDIKLVRRGYYPRGGGLVKVNIQQINKLLPLKTVRGTLKDIIGYAHISNLPLDVMHRLKSSMYGKLNDNMKKHLKVIEEINSYPAFDKGAAIVLCAYFENTIIGTSQLGKKGVRAEDLGSAVGEELTNYLEKDVNVDIYAADQLLPYLALCTEECELNVSEITLHTATNIALIKKFIDCDITVRENEVKKIYIK
jgi:RNA 3'-phosphate cyclase